MLSNQKLERIEGKIDRDLAGGLAINPGAGSGVFTIAPRSMGELMEFAKLMAVSGPCVRPAFRSNPGACLAIAVQAFKWGADPFAVANKAYITRNKANEEQIAYEAQLVHAIVNSSSMLLKRLRPVYEGEGQNRRCRIVGWVKGEDQALEYESPTIAKIAVKNSPLWNADPDQQLFYYSTRAWARRHVPEILLGIYTSEEIRGEIIDIDPVLEPEPVREPDSEVVEDEPDFEVTDDDGEVFTFHEAETAAKALRELYATAARRGPQFVAGATESNRAVQEQLEQLGQRFEIPPAEPPFPGDRSMAIPMPQRAGKPDYRGWALGLLLPRVHQAATSADLALLLGDNEATIAEAKRVLATADRQELERGISTRWDEIAEIERGE